MIRYFLISVIISITAVSCFSQTNTKYQEKEFTDKAGKTLFYRMLEPEMSYYEKYPLIIFLHGAGERGSDNKSQLIHGAKLFEKKENMKNYPAFVIAKRTFSNPTKNITRSSGDILPILSLGTGIFYWTLQKKNLPNKKNLFGILLKNYSDVLFSYTFYKRKVGWLALQIPKSGKMEKNSFYNCCLIIVFCTI